MVYGNFWRSNRERYWGDRTTDYDALGWSPEGEWFGDKPSGYVGEGYSGKRYRSAPRGIDYERNWQDEGRNAYGDRDYYGRREYDEVPGEYRRKTGGFVGRGPKGYTRSDERIREDVCELLTDDPRVDASNIDVKVENSEITLTGTVHAREDKRLAEDLADRVSGVKDVQNRLRVAVGEAKGNDDH